MDSINKSLDAPSADSFVFREKWVVLSKDANTQKCMMRVTYNIEFVKYSFFKSTILSKAPEGIKENFYNWKKFTTELGYFKKKELAT